MKNRLNNTAGKTTIGWKEWCALPDLDLPAIKAKIDTGAKTSALHAYDIRISTQNHIDYVHFKVHPLQRNNNIERICTAPLLDYKKVTSSNGEQEKRYVITTQIAFPICCIMAKITLTSRHNMTYRMLLGREAIRKAHFTVDPSQSFLLGKKENIESLYNRRTS